MSGRAALLAGWMLSGAAVSADFEFVRVVHSGTEAPGAVSDFALLGAPALDGETVAFRALASGPGIWIWREGRLRLVAHGAASLPTAVDDFARFGAPSLAGDSLAALSRSARLRKEGIYQERDGRFELLLDVDSDLEPGARPFLGFLELWQGKNGLAFAAVTAAPEPREALYLIRKGELVRIAEEGARTPDGDRLQVLREPALSGDLVFFLGKGRESSGIYRIRDGELEAVVTTKRAPPGLELRFEGFEHLSARRGGLAFVAKSPDRSGVYRVYGGLLQTVVDTTSAHGPKRSLSGFGGVCADAAEVGFHAWGPGLAEGVYATYGGEIRPVIERGDRLFGGRVSSLELGPQCRSRERVAFQAGFEDGSQAIVIASPSP